MSTEYTFEGWMGDNVSSSEGKMVCREFEPKPWEETDVDIKVSRCGVCGLDLHVLRSGWDVTEYPYVVGHEILSVAVRVGSKADNGIKMGDVVGVGAQSDTCLGRDGACAPCNAGLNQYCSKAINTYNDRHRNNGKAYGGYALCHRAPSHFVFKIPSGLTPESAAPLLCGGITVYSTLKYHGAGPGRKIGVVVIGGPRHFDVLFAKAVGVDEVGISRGENKIVNAMSLGCDDYIATSDDADCMKMSRGRCPCSLQRGYRVRDFARPVAFNSWMKEYFDAFKAALKDTGGVAHIAMDMGMNRHNKAIINRTIKSELQFLEGASKEFSMESVDITSSLVLGALHTTGRP